jgi:hypothetical protein
LTNTNARNQPIAPSPALPNALGTAAALHAETGGLETWMKMVEPEA